MSTNKELMAALSAPFPPADVEWRVQQAGVSASGNPWVMVVPYITSRAVQQRLDDVCGLGWQNVQKPTPDGKGYLCGISIKVGDDWVTRWDGAEYTDIEPLKGALSGSMKRAGVLWGIGRYLYQMDGAIFADCRAVSSRRECVGHYQHIKPKGGANPVHCDWKPPVLPEWALPRVDYTPFEQALKQATTLDELKNAFAAAYKAARTANRRDLVERFETFKDQGKERIHNDAATHMAENLAAITSWLDKQIAAFAMVPNASSVKGLHRAVLSDLEQRCEGQLFDTAPLYQALDAAYKDRETQLTQKGH